MGNMEDRIIDATSRLFVKEGIRMSMDDIVRKIGISKATIYKYFTDKQTLFQRVGERLLLAYADRLKAIEQGGDALTNRLYSCLNALLEFTDCGELALCMELALNNAHVEKAYENYRQTYRRTVLALAQEGIQEGLFKNDLNAEELFDYIDMSVAYYQQNAAYRDRMRFDTAYRNRFLLFYIGNIFKQGSQILQALSERAENPTQLQYFICLAKTGTTDCVEEIMKHLNMDMSIAESKFIDFALSHVQTEEGVKAMEHYLFFGTQVQRNYCTLYFARRGEYLLVRQAYDKGLIDARQAFSR